MRRCVIVGGADIHDYPLISNTLREDDWFVYCDSGLKHMDGLRRLPDLIVGDFDSQPNPGMDIETLILPREKDDTDTVYAAKEAIRRGFNEFLLIGVTGQRLDHTLGNVAILLYLDSLDRKGMIADDLSEMEIVSRNPAYVSESYSYFSLLNITGCAQNVSVTGAKYPLTDAEISCEYPYGISNEVLPGQTAEIRVGCGKLLLIRIR